MMLRSTTSKLHVAALTEVCLRSTGQIDSPAAERQQRLRQHCGHERLVWQPKSGGDWWYEHVWMGQHGQLLSRSWVVSRNGSCSLAAAAGLGSFRSADWVGQLRCWRVWRRLSHQLPGCPADPSTITQPSKVLPLLVSDASSSRHARSLHQEV